MVNDENEDSKLWDRQERESSKKYFLFTIFRDFGPSRKLREVVERYNEISKEDSLTLSYIQKLSAQNNWIDRVYAYDVHMQKLLIDGNEHLVKDMKSRHSILAKRFQNLIMEALEYGHSKYKEMNSNQVGYYIDSLSRALERCARLERVSYGTEDLSNQEFKELKYTIEEVQQVIADPETNRKISGYLEFLDKGKKNKDEKKEVVLIST